MESSFILRAPAEVASALHETVRGRNLGLALSADSAPDRFQLHVSSDAGQQVSLPAHFVAAPTHIDASKPFGDGVVHAQSVSRVMMVHHNEASAAVAAEEQTAIDPLPGSELRVALSGITPPTRKIVNRQFSRNWRFLSKYTPQEITEAERVIIDLAQADKPMYEHVVEELVDVEGFMYDWFKPEDGTEGGRGVDNVTCAYEHGVLVDVFSMRKGDIVRRAGREKPFSGVSAAGAASSSTAVAPTAVAAAPAAGPAAGAGAASSKSTGAAAPSAAAASLPQPPVAAVLPSNITTADMLALAQAYNEEDEEGGDENDLDEDGGMEGGAAGGGGDVDHDGGHGHDDLHDQGDEGGDEEADIVLESGDAAAGDDQQQQHDEAGAAAEYEEGDGGEGEEFEEEEEEDEEAGDDNEEAQVGADEGMDDGAGGDEHDGDADGDWAAEGDGAAEQQDADAEQVGTQYAATQPVDVGEHEDDQAADTQAVMPSHPVVEDLRARLAAAQASLDVAQTKLDTTKIEAFKARNREAVARAQAEVQRLQAELQHAEEVHGAH